MILGGDCLRVCVAIVNGLSARSFSTSFIFVILALGVVRRGGEIERHHLDQVSLICFSSGQAKST